jgi:hypothetical protein
VMGLQDEHGEAWRQINIPRGWILSAAEICIQKLYGCFLRVLARVAFWGMPSSTFSRDTLDRVTEGLRVSLPGTTCAHDRQVRQPRDYVMAIMAEDSLSA